MNDNHFHAVNQQNQVGDHNTQSQRVGQRDSRYLRRFLAAARDASLATQCEHLLNQSSEAQSEEAVEPPVALFADEGPVSEYLNAKTQPEPAFWLQLKPYAEAIQKAFAALGKSAIEHWIQKNPRVQPLLDFANALIDELS